MAFILEASIYLLPKNKFIDNKILKNSLYLYKGAF
ncbi:hypothetical protein ABIB62_004206 [Mucilaginibacter sp. UYP25]